MPKPGATLTVFNVKNEKKPGRYGDGNGLWLQVQTAERKSWLFRYSFKGKAHEMGLGPYPAVTLAEAREKARAQRTLLRQGTDPLAAKLGQSGDTTPAALSFRMAAENLIESKRTGWRNAKHTAQWKSSLIRYAFPLIGDTPARGVTVKQVRSILEPIWKAKHETASRLRGRIEDVLWSAAVEEQRQAGYQNPAVWKGNLAYVLPHRGLVHREQHHIALPWSAAPRFMVRLRQAEGLGARALEWTILTAARSNMTIGAVWSEVNEAERVWTVPGCRNKSGQEMRVPLSEGALAILGGLRPLRRPDYGDFIFPGLKLGRPISNMTMASVLRRFGMKEDVHGFRSTFRDWAGEETQHASDVAEAALDHRLPGGTSRAAYQRGDLFKKRAALAEAWSRYLDTPVID